MIQWSPSPAELVSPLIKLVKQREELYFQLISFVNKNIECSSNDLDHLALFNKFLLQANVKQQQTKQKEDEFFHTFKDYFEESNSMQEQSVTNELLRLSSRLIEILQASISKIRKTLFDDSGRTTLQFTRFKLMLNKLLKKESFIAKEYAEFVISYCSNKYLKQISKIKRYIDKWQSGVEICFRDVYTKEKSDIDHSPSPQKIEKQHGSLIKKTKAKCFESGEEGEKKKLPLKKAMKIGERKKEKSLNVKQKEKQSFVNENRKAQTKQQAANKILKFYALLEINKKQFLEDFVYEKIDEQKHKNELLEKLFEMNKDNNKQINSFIKRTSTFIPTYPSPNKSSGDERTDSVVSKISLKTSFVISKRKSSCQFDNSLGNQKIVPQIERKEPFERTIKNINPRRRASQSNKTQQKSNKKIFVIKAPMVFQDEIIPQTPMTQTQWFQAPLPVKCKNESIRLKRKNYLNPMDNVFLQQNFRYPL